MNIKWSEADKTFIRENAHRLKDAEIAAELTASSGRQVTLQSVRKMRQKLGIKKLAGRGVCGVISQGGDNSDASSKSTIHQLVNS